MTFSEKSLKIRFLFLLSIPMTRTAFFAILGLPLLLTACATTHKGSITPQYINPTTYQHQSCDGLSEEIRRVSVLAEQTEKQQTPLSATGVGIGIAAGRGGIYPTISLGIGKGAGSHKKATLSKLYGEHDAMVIAARQKGCAFAKTIKIYGE